MFKWKLKAQAKLKNMKSQECYQKFSEKKVYLHLSFLFFISYLFIFWFATKKIFFGWKSPTRDIEILGLCPVGSVGWWPF